MMISPDQHLDMNMTGTQAGTDDHILDLLAVAHAMVNYTDTVARIIATRLQIDPSDEAITEAVWNISDAKEALKLLKGDAPSGQCDVPEKGRQDG